METESITEPQKVKKQYKQILPLRTDVTVKEQFQFTPLSVLEPSKDSKKSWTERGAYLDVQETRRSADCEYLPGLKFSEFHAGLAENIVRYWSVEGDNVVDPFCGRVTRAFVTTSLGRNYTGFEVAENTYKRVTEHLTKLNLSADIRLDDGCLLNGINNDSTDFIYSCPPYFALEVYQEANNQLSRLDSYNDFLNQIHICISNCYRVLKPGKFMCFVVADFRWKGKLESFSSDFINISKVNKFIHWDTIIIKNFSPFAALQMGKVASKRYTSKIHEYLLVFRKPE